MRQISGVGRGDAFGSLIQQGVGVDFLLKDRVMEISIETHAETEIIALGFAELRFQCFP